MADGEQKGTEDLGAEQHPQAAGQGVAQIIESFPVEIAFQRLNMPSMASLSLSFWSTAILPAGEASSKARRIGITDSDFIGSNHAPRSVNHPLLKQPAGDAKAGAGNRKSQR